MFLAPKNLYKNLKLLSRAEDRAALNMVPLGKIFSLKEKNARKILNVAYNYELY
jgi:hypothetical protein